MSFFTNIRRGIGAATSLIDTIEKRNEPKIGSGVVSGANRYANKLKELKSQTVKKDGNLALLPNDKKRIIEPFKAPSLDRTNEYFGGAVAGGFAGRTKRSIAESLAIQTYVPVFEGTRITAATEEEAVIAQRENLIEKKYGKPEDFKNVTPGNLPDYLKSLPGEKIPSFVPVVGGRTISVRSVSELLEIGVIAYASYYTYGGSNVALSYVSGEREMTKERYPEVYYSIPSITIPEFVPMIGGSEISGIDIAENIGLSRSAGLMEAKILGHAAKYTSKLKSPIMKGATKLGAWLAAQPAFDLPQGLIEKPREEFYDQPEGSRSLSDEANARWKNAKFQVTVGLIGSAVMQGGGTAFKETNLKIKEVKSGAKLGVEIKNKLKKSFPDIKPDELQVKLFEAMDKAGLSVAQKLGAFSQVEGGFVKGPQFKKPVPAAVKNIKPVDDLTKVIQEENSIRNRLGEIKSIAGDKFNEELVNTLEEISTATPGQRIFEEGEFSYNIESTFPKWIPESLKSNDLINKVSQLIAKNKEPPFYYKRQRALYDVIMSKVESKFDADAPKLRDDLLMIAEDKELLKTKLDFDKYMSKKSKTPKKQVKSVKSSIREITGQKKTPVYKEELHDRFEPEKLTEIPAKFTSKNLSTYYKGLEKTMGKEPSVTLKFDELKDLNDYSKSFVDTQRNFEKMFTKGSETYKVIKKKILDPLYKSYGDSADYVKAKRTELKENIVEKFGIKKDTRMSADVQKLGEGEVKFDELKNDIGETKANIVKEATQWFRGQYDEMINNINVQRRNIYGQNTDKIIKKRKDYFRHFQDMEGLDKLHSIFSNEQRIDPQIAGKSADTKPKTKWASIAQARLGNKTKYDAVAGFLEYLPQAAQEIHINKNIPTLRKLEADMRQISTEKGTTEINKSIEFVTHLTNRIAGKTNIWDRSFVEGSRSITQAASWAVNRIKSNLILGNIRSTISQTSNIPQGFASAGSVNFIKGSGVAFANIFTGKKSELELSSPFLKERLQDPISMGFESKKRKVLKNFAVWFLGKGDEIGTRMTWNSMIVKGEKLGIKGNDLIDYADNKTKKVVASRSAADLPIAQSSNFITALAPFQVEVQNSWHLMKDFVDEKTYFKFVELAIGSYLIGEGQRQITGSETHMDLVNAFIEEIEKDSSIDKIIGRMAGEVFSNVMFGQSLAVVAPNKLFGYKKKDFFGKGDPTRYGSLYDIKSERDLAAKFLLPWGGNQVKKTLEGVEALSEGGLRDKKGKLHAPIVNPSDKLKALLFGKTSTQTTQDYYSNIGVKSENRHFDNPEVELLNTSKDTPRIAEVYLSIPEDRREALKKELSVNQRKSLGNNVIAYKIVNKIELDEKEMKIYAIEKKNPRKRAIQNRIDKLREPKEAVVVPTDEAIDKHAELKSMDKTQANTIMKQLKVTDPELYSMIKSIEKRD